MIATCGIDESQNIYILNIRRGRSGLTRFVGHIDEEWSGELSSSKGARVYKKMATGDAL